MKRNSSIDIIRILIAVLVIVVHIKEFFGSIATHTTSFLSIYLELFFIISGFFMMQHLDKQSVENETTFGFVIHKIKGFFAPLCIVNFGHILLNCCMTNTHSIKGVFEKFWHFKWEFILLQCAGFIRKPQFNKDYLIGPTWYLSALVLATLLLYPIAKNYRKVFLNIVCPIIILVTYCVFTQAYGNTNIGNEFLLGISDAVVRALAGVCCGALFYSAYLWLQNKECNKQICIIEAASWIMIPVSLLIGTYGKANSGLFMIIPFGIIVVTCILNYTPIAQTLNKIPNSISSFLGKLSLYVYLTHWTALFSVMYFMPKASNLVKIPTAILITLIYSLALYFIDKKRKDMKIIFIICLVLFLINILVCGVLM